MNAVPVVCKDFSSEYIQLFSVCRDEKAQLADIFLKKGPYLKMYSTYIREFDRNVALLEVQTKKNPAFGALVREFEVKQLAQPVFSMYTREAWPLRQPKFHCLFTIQGCICWFYCSTCPGQSSLCQPGAEALPAEAGPEDSSVPAAAHR